MKAEKFRIYEEYMREHMLDSAHDEGHIRRVMGMALTLAGREKNVNADVLTAAALLHDVGREEQFRTGESHALISARMAESFLSGLGEDEAFVSHVCACIRTHSFRRNDPPASAEARLLYDADKLDVAGAVGIARTFLYQGRETAPVYSLGPRGEVLTGEERTPSFYSEYRHKLQSMGSRFLTPAARKRAAVRCEAAARFVEALRAEVAAGESGPGWRMLPGTADARQRRVFNLALLMAGSCGHNAYDELAAIVMQGDAVRAREQSFVLVREAGMLDGEGALGIAQRFMELGSKRGSMERIFGERPRNEYRMKHAQSMANVRRAAAEAYLEDLRAELRESLEGTEGILESVLE